MNKTSIGVLALVVGMIIGGMLTALVPAKGQLGGVTIGDEYMEGNLTVTGTIASADLSATDDISVTDDLTVGGDAAITGDAVISGGSLILTDSSTATSSVEVGCIETKATSTASDIKLYLGVDGSTATTTMFGTASRGIVYWGFGSCD